MARRAGHREPSRRAATHIQQIDAPEVVIVGGHHDGLIGIVGPECVRLRFLVESSTDSNGDEWWHAYRWDGTERDTAGRLVFRPAGRPQ